MITKELSTKGQQIFQGVLHSAKLRLRAVEHANTSHKHPFLAAEGWLSPQRKASRLPAPLWGPLSAAPASRAAAGPRCWGRGRQPATAAIFPLLLFFFSDDKQAQSRLRGTSRRVGGRAAGRGDAAELPRGTESPPRPRGKADRGSGRLGEQAASPAAGPGQHGGLQTALGGGKCPQPPVALLP